MSRPRSGKKPVHLEVTGLAPLPLAIEKWERTLLEPALASLFDLPKPIVADTKEERDGEAS